MDKFLAIIFNSDISFVLQLFAAELLVFCGKEFRKFGWLYLIVGVMLTLGVSLLWRVSFNSSLAVATVLSVLRYIVLFLICTVTVYFTFKCTVSETIFFAITGYTMQHMATSIAWIIAIGGFFDFVIENFTRLQYFNWASCIVVYTIMFFTVIHRIKRREIKLGILLLTIPSALILLTSMIMNFVLIELRFNYPVTEVYHIVFCMIVFFFLSGLYRNNELNEEKERIEYMLEAQEKHRKLSTESINAINIKCHDMKKQLETIVKINTTKELNAYKREIENSVDDYDMIADTGNESLNVVLTERAIFCKSKDIKFSYMADGKLLSFMSAVDVYSMFGNALDNAISAVLKLPPEKRIINVLLNKETNMVSIHIENFFSGGLEFKDGIPVTTKEDKSQHGFGIKSIKMIAEKYGGTATVFIDNDIFNLNILLPVN